MNTITTRYLPTLLPLVILVWGVLDVAQKTGTALLSWQTITQVVILVATTGAAYWLPLVPGRWAGAFKTGAALVGALASALVAYVPDGHFTQATLFLFITAALKAVAVQAGVSIRVNAGTVIDAREATGVSIITAADLVPFDTDTAGLDDGEVPKHLAAS